MKYKALFIDWDGTLSNSRFWDRWRETDNYAAIQKVLFIEGDKYLYDWMTGRIVFSAVLEYIERRTGIPYSDLKEELLYSAKNMKFIDDDAMRVIADLRKSGIKVVIATDNMDTFRHWTIPSMRLAELFDGILVSDTQGALKSEVYKNGESKFFNQYLNENNIQHGEAALIDNNIDLKKVEDFGIDFIHINKSRTLHDYLRGVLESEIVSH